MSKPNQRKLLTVEELASLAKDCHDNGQKVVMCHGVFDLLHLGHMRYLNSARQFGDILIATIVPDRFVMRGPGRPVFNETQRAEALENLSVVDYVGVCEGKSAQEAIRLIKPDFFARGEEFTNPEKDIDPKTVEEDNAVFESGGKVVYTDDLRISSGRLINLYLDSYPETTVSYLRQVANKYPVEKIGEYFKRAKRLKVLVVGDAIIDQYHYCSVMGKSAKESILAHRHQSSEDFAGGVLATANHLAQVCDRIDLITVLGEKNSFEGYIRQQLDAKVSPVFFSRPGCVTTTKRRYISDDGTRKLFEIVDINDHLLSAKEEELIADYLEEKLPTYDLVVVNDFGHGMMTRTLMELICRKAKILTLNVQTNSANVGFNLVTKFLRADLVCIDELELRLATRDNRRDLGELMLKIASFLDSKQVLVTRGPRGSFSYFDKEGFVETPALADKVVDKMGAGDAFFAYASPCYAVDMPHELTAFVGNAVGALKIQVLGNRGAVKQSDLTKFMARLLKV